MLNYFLFKFSFMNKCILFCGVIILICFASCSSDDQLYQPMEDFPFISLPDETDFSNLSSEEMLIAFEAEPRLRVFINEDGLFETKVKSGKEINISENIYKFFINIYEASNEELIANAGKERVPLLSRGEFDGYTGIFDCLAHAVSNAQDTYDYDFISDMLYYNYGSSGVPINRAYAAMSLFGNPTQITYSPESGVYTNNYIFIISNSNGSFHAVNGGMFSGDIVYCYDGQANQMKSYSTSSIYAIYMYPY